MKLDVTKAILQLAKPFPFSGEVAIPPQDVNGETITFDTVTLEGTFFAGDDSTIRVDGTVKTVAHGQCARCMQPAATPINITFGETFAKNVDEAEDERFTFTGKEINLDHMTLTLCLLTLPGRFLCKDDCEGSPAWKAYQANHKPQIEEGSYHPFAQLGSLLNMDEEV